MPDGSIQIVELVEKPVPTAQVQFKSNGSIALSRRVSREGILAASRADRDSSALV